MLDTLSYFVKNDDLPVEPLCVNHAIMSIFSFLSSTDEEDQAYACHIVYAILKSDNTGVKKNLVTQHGGVRAFCKLLSSSGEYDQQIGLAGLRRVRATVLYKALRSILILTTCTHALLFA